MRVLRLPPEIIGQFYGGEISFPVIVYGGVDGDQVRAAGGLAWMDGRCVVWFNVFGDFSAHAITLARWCRRMLRMASQLGESEVFVYRDDEHSTSKRLIELMGFEFFEVDGVTGKEVYRCLV